MTNKIILTVVGVVAVVAAFLVGKSFGSPVVLGGQAASGTTFNSAKVAQVNMVPLAAGANATTSSILNTDDNNRYIRNAFGFCTNVGTSYPAAAGSNLAALTVSTATTSTSVPVQIANTNLASNLTISTSTAYSSQASTTVSAGVFSLWAPGTYLTFFFNATNTASCTVGVEYAAS